MTVENFVRLDWTVFEKFEKSLKKWPFSDYLWVSFGYVSHILAINFDAIAHIGLSYGVERLLRFSFESY